MPTIQQQINQLKKDKETLNTMLNTMGVETTGNETFTQLTPLVGKIVTDPILQDKSITITENGTTNIVADEGYDGLNNVEVITNIENTSTGSKMNLFIQTNEPEEKNGIWIQKESEEINDVAVENIDLTQKWNYDIGTVPASAYSRVVKYENYLYVFGGRNSSGTAINNAYKYNLDTNQYSNITNLPIASMSPAIGIVGTKVYIFGGESNGAYHTNAYKYDILNDTYEEIKSLPQSISQAGYVTSGTDIYILGGTNSTVLKTIYKYDTLTDTYTQLANMPIANRTISAVLVGTDIYVLGGLTTSGYTASCYKYNISNNSWATLTSLPQALGHSACGYINGDIYMFAGFGVSGGTTTFYKYNIQTNKFTTLTNLSKSIFNAGYTCIGNKMYLVSGQSSSGYLTTVSTYGLNTKTVFEEDTVILSPDTNSYTTKLTSNISVGFDNVYLYENTNKVYTKPSSYYGDGTKWIKI